MKTILSIILLASSLFGFVGKITALKGNANIIRDNKPLVAEVGFKLTKQDIIKTKKNTKMQIIFNDNTVVTIGKNSKLKISDYLFDNTTKSKAKFRLSYGIMKTLTGKIGKVAKKRFKVFTKNASIGIRGTYFIVQSEANSIKISMLSGITTFTNLDNMKQVIVKSGQQLVFNEKTKNIIKHPFNPITHKINKQIIIKQIKQSIALTPSDIVKDITNITSKINTKTTVETIQKNTKKVIDNYQIPDLQFIPTNIPQ